MDHMKGFNTFRMFSLSGAGEQEVTLLFHIFEVL